MLAMHSLLNHRLVPAASGQKLILGEGLRDRQEVASHGRSTEASRFAPPVARKRVVFLIIRIARRIDGVAENIPSNGFELVGPCPAQRRHRRFVQYAQTKWQRLF